MEKAQLLTGHVVHGKALGRTVGMPTANLQPDEGSMLPPEGVYATLAYVKDEMYLSVTNIGTRPSVDASAIKTVESFLIDFEGDLYGAALRLELLEKIRDIMKMSSLEEVQRQVQKDIASAKDIFKRKFQKRGGE